MICTTKPWSVLPKVLVSMKSGAAVVVVPLNLWTCSKLIGEGFYRAELEFLVKELTLTTWWCRRIVSCGKS